MLMEKTCSLDRQLHQPTDGGATEPNGWDLTRCLGGLGFTIPASHQHDIFLLLGLWQLAG
jgi:hypothetical protein